MGAIGMPLQRICSLVLVTILISSVEGISFQDLVDRAEAADRPQPKKAPKKLLPTLDEVAHQEDLKEWSTDHLLGLDAPPPADFMAQILPKSLQETHQTKEPVQHTEAAKQVHQHPSDIVPEDDDDVLVHPMQALHADEDLSMHPTTPQKDVAAEEKTLAPPNLDDLLHGHDHKLKKASHKATHKVQKADKQSKTSKVEANPLAVSLFSRLNAHKTHEHKEDAMPKLLHLSDSEDEPKPTTHMLTGLASSLINKARQANNKRELAEVEHKKQADALAKQRERIKREGDRAAGGPLPELNLDVGDDEPATPSQPKAEDLPSLGNFLNVGDGGDDDDDFLQTDSW